VCAIIYRITINKADEKIKNNPQRVINAEGHQKSLIIDMVPRVYVCVETIFGKLGYP